MRERHYTRKDTDMKAAIIMGSTSDLSKVEPAVEILKKYGVEVNVRRSRSPRSSRHKTRL